jgi:hypothetical protein
MPTYKTKHFDTAQELWNSIRPEEIGKHIGYHRYPIFRGQANAEWKLNPNASRNAKDRTIRDQAIHEMTLLLYFLNYCDSIGIQVPGHTVTVLKNLKNYMDIFNSDKHHSWPQNEFFEVLAFAQHFGVSTRLLDWSRRSFVAAYFASSEAVKIIANEIQQDLQPDFNKNLSIWILETDMINTLNSNMGHGIEEREARLPLSIVNIPSGVNFHVAAQQGCFTIHRDIIKDDDEFEFTNILSSPKFCTEKTIDCSRMYFTESLNKWTLPYREAHKLLNLCELYNVNSATIYPSATGAGYAVKDKMNYELISDFFKVKEPIHN